MDFFKKIQSLNVFWKKVIVFSVIAALGVPLVFWVGRNFQKRMIEFNKEEFWQRLKVPQTEEEMGEIPFEQLGETKRKLGEELKKLEEMAREVPTTTTSTPTSTTSTSTPTSTTSTDNQ